MNHLIPIPVLPNPSNGSGARELDPGVARAVEIFDRMSNKFQANPRLEYCLEQERDGFLAELQALCALCELIIEVNHDSSKAMSQLSNFIAQMGTAQSADRRMFRDSVERTVIKLHCTTQKFQKCRSVGVELCSRLENRIMTFKTAPNKGSKSRVQQAKEWATDYRSVVIRRVCGFLTLIGAAISLPNLGDHPHAAALATVNATVLMVNEMTARDPPSAIERRWGRSAFVQLSNLWGDALPQISESLHEWTTPEWVQPAGTGTLLDWVLGLENQSNQARLAQITVLHSAVQEQHFRCGIARQLIVQVGIYFLPSDDPSETTGWEMSLGSALAQP